jgi:hypothetical protein
MLKPEEFAQIAQAVNDKEDLTYEQAIALVRTIQHMDLQLVIGQNALQLAMENINTVVPALAERVLERSGRTDKKIKKSVAEIAAEVVSSCDVSLQTYIANAIFEASRILEMTIEEFMGVEETEEETEEETDAQAE